LLKRTRISFLPPNEASSTVAAYRFVVAFICDQPRAVLDSWCCSGL